MEIFNIGPLELIFIIALMIIVLGPEGMKQTVRTVGTWIRKTRQSSVWKEIQSATREVEQLPVRLAREAGYEEHIAEIKKNTNIQIDLYDQPARQPGDSPSHGSRRLRAPQKRGYIPEPVHDDLPQPEVGLEPVDDLTKQPE
jgi:Sec-independent protein translocase protein TatA